MQAIDRDFPSVPSLITVNQARDAAVRMADSNTEERAFVDYVMDPAKIMLPDAPSVTSQYRYWIDNQDTLNIMGAATARNEIDQNVPTPYSFPVSQIMSLLREHKARSIFDPSAGWGEVLMAVTLSPGVVYVGVAPTRSPVFGTGISPTPKMQYFKVGETPTPKMQYFYEQVIHITGTAGRCSIVSSIVDVARESHDMVVCALSHPSLARHNPTDIIVLLLTSWSKLKPGGVMYVFVNTEMIVLNDIFLAIGSFPDVQTRSTEGEMMKWTKKSAQLYHTSTSRMITITLDKNVYNLHGQSSHARALQSYVNVLPDKTYYIARLKDNVALDLARAFPPSMLLRVYVPRNSALITDIQRANPAAETIEYEQYESVKAEYGNVALPQGIDTPSFVAVMIKVLSDSLAHLAKPKRVWLSVDSLTVLKALLTVWPDTVFLCLCLRAFNKKKLQLRDRHRAMIVVSRDLDLMKVAKQQGYASDAIYLN